MRIQLPCFDECPNWQVADARPHEALTALGSPTPVERVLVSTDAAWGFHGSLSILVDGTDPFAEPDAPVGLSCRLCPSPAGVGGSPTLEQLVGVRTRA